MTDDPKPVFLASPKMSEAGYELEFVHEAFASNWVAPLGPNVDAFEREFSTKIGAVDAAALSSGTAAIHLALKLVGVGEGILPNDPDARDPKEDVVLCSSLTFSASVNPVVYQGATPVFIDADEKTWNMDPELLQEGLEKYGKRVKAVIVAHLFGLIADMDKIHAICDAFEVPLIEDAAESLGTLYDSCYYQKEGETSRQWHEKPIRRHAGTAADMGCFSFNGNKIITTSGGGMLTGNNPETAMSSCKKARFWSTQSREDAPWYQHEELGYNYRMSNVVAGIGRGQLKVLDRHIEEKEKIFHYYKKHLEQKNKVSLMPVPEDVFPNYWLSVARFEDSRKVMEVYGALAEKNIASRPMWKPMNLQPFYRHCDFISKETVSVGEKLFESCLCLPSDINSIEEDLECVVHIIKEQV